MAGYNIGISNPVELKEYVSTLESALGKTARKELLSLQPGDVPDTFVNVEDLMENLECQPFTSIDTGINRFVDWLKNHHSI